LERANGIIAGLNDRIEQLQTRLRLT